MFCSRDRTLFFKTDIRIWATFSWHFQQKSFSCETTYDRLMRIAIYVKLKINSIYQSKWKTNVNCIVFTVCAGKSKPITLSFRLAFHHHDTLISVFFFLSPVHTLNAFYGCRFFLSAFELSFAHFISWNFSFKSIPTILLSHTSDSESRCCYAVVCFVFLFLSHLVSS